MLRLKSRTEHPPYDFQLLLPQVGMKTPITGSFLHCVEEFAKIVRANPAQAAKYNWPNFYEGQVDWVDIHNAERLQASGWGQFTTDGSEAYILPPPSQKKTLRVGVAAVKNLLTGASIWKDLFGEKESTVDGALAEKRALVCSTCPENDTKTSLVNLFTTELASQLTSLFELLKGKQMTTSLDDKLGVCKVCLCPVRAKVHADIGIIRKHLKPETEAKLPGWCWIKTEPSI